MRAVGQGRNVVAERARVEHLPQERPNLVRGDAKIGTMPLIEAVLDRYQCRPGIGAKLGRTNCIVCTTCEELLPDLVHVDVEVHEVRPWRKNSVQNNSVGLCRVELEVAQNVVGGVGSACHEDLLARLAREIDETTQIARRLGGAEEGEPVSQLLADNLAAGSDEIRCGQAGCLLIGTGECL